MLDEEDDNEEIERYVIGDDDKMGEKEMGRGIKEKIRENKLR